MGRKLPPITNEEIIRKRDELFDTLSKESDRGVVLVGVSFLEEALESFLRARFSIRYPKSKSSINPLFSTFGPLSSFWAKIIICYAMDMIGGWMYQDLEIIRKLRNSFAHNLGIARFDLPEVIKLTERLKAADLAVTMMPKQKSTRKNARKAKKTKGGISKPTKAVMERARFETSVTFIGGVLYFLTRVLTSNLSLHDKENVIKLIRLKMENSNDKDSQISNETIKINEFFIIEDIVKELSKGL